MSEPAPHVPPGRPDSPIPSDLDIERALRRAEESGRELPGIDLRESEQLALIDELARHYPDLADGSWMRRFTYDNTWFTYADAILMALFMLHFHPRRIVEVGSGHSTALMLDVNDAFLHGDVVITTIDPSADRLRDIVDESELEGRLIESIVQDVPLSTFDALRSGDILAIDSSHVLKAGSDVKHLIDDVLPRLASGVLVHIHDVFYPFEYPQSWLRGGADRNEDYALRALLSDSSRYRILLFTDFLISFHADLLQARMPLVLERPFPTGGIWLAIADQS